MQQNFQDLFKFQEMRIIWINEIRIQLDDCKPMSSSTFKNNNMNNKNNNNKQFKLEFQHGKHLRQAKKLRQRYLRKLDKINCLYKEMETICDKLQHREHLIQQREQELGVPSPILSFKFLNDSRI